MSPFVRKAMICINETGWAERIERVRSPVAIDQPNHTLLRDNPLNKIPTLVLDDGTVLFDSCVICEYFDALQGGGALFPKDMGKRWTALRRQALGDGMLDVLLLWRRERDKPAERQEPALLAAFKLKIETALAALETEAPALDATPFDIGHVAIGCALSYLDFRFSAWDWRKGLPKLVAWHNTFESRPSVQKTTPVIDR
jgi:glutathione S-transferase